MPETPVVRYNPTTLFIVLSLVGLIFIPCSQGVVKTIAVVFGPFQTQLHPTYDELDRRGYYAYVVPPSLAEQYEWQEETFIWSWSRHCNADSHSRYNPLTITYFDEKDERVFRIEMSPWGLIEWTPFQPTVAIPFDFPGAKTETLELFEREYGGRKFLYLRYEDWYGTPVYVISQLPLAETLTLLYTLNYVGAPPEQAEPWERCDYW